MKLQAICAAIWIGAETISHMRTDGVTVTAISGSLVFLGLVLTVARNWLWGGD